ncbi:terminase [Actinomyces sp. 432]|uniref:terminase n=1 Tax=Actinomyces sp. 432 TaxID=2057798 RepID=UPI0013796CDA|nr:terminase [Actinomyces sp. 432]
MSRATPPRTRTGRRSSPRRDRLSDVAKHLILPEGVASTGWPAIRDRCARIGSTFDEWQDGLGRCIFAKRADGLYAAGIDGVQMSMPRQVGKTYTVGSAMFALCTLQPGLLVLWTAHRTRTADETFEYMQGVVRRPAAARYVPAGGVRRANGEQQIRFHNGSRILFGAREGGFGRGFAGVDVLIFDEAQILGQRALDDMVPSTNTSPNPLIIRMGTPPKPTDPSEAFATFRRQALEGDLRDGLYVELGADDTADPNARAQWRKANPSYPHRTPESSILRMKRQLGPESFRREGLGIWDPALSDQAIGRSVWKALEVEDAPVGARWCAAVRFAADGSTVAVARAGREIMTRAQWRKAPRERTRRVHVELCTEQGVRQMGHGVQWVVDYLVAHRDRWAQIVVDGKSGAGDLIERLRAEGIPAKVLWTPTAADVITAHAMFDAAIREQTLTHLQDPELEEEAAVVSRRRIGNGGGFGWQAPEGMTSAGLDAATLAAWAVKTTKRRPRATAIRRGVVMT